MLKNPLHLLELVSRLENLMRAEYRRLGSDEGLQAIHVQALLFIKHSNRFSNTPMALSEYLGLTKGTVSQSLMVLDRKGLIERLVDDEDKRVVRLHLTPQGEAYLTRANPEGLWQVASRDISAHRIRYSVSALRDLVYEIQHIKQGSTFGVCSTCAYCQKKSPRIHHCGWYGERLSGPDTRKICRDHVPRNGGNLNDPD